MRLAATTVLLAALVASGNRARAQELEVAGSPIGIERFHVDATVEESVARVTVDETFRNASDRIEEGVFRFKLPEDAVIGSFSMWMAGKEKHGRVLEAKQARATYDAIVRKARDPGLLEQIGWREFRVSVYPIPARDTVRVRLVYAHVLRDDLGLQTLEVPLPAGPAAVGDLRVRATVAESAALAAVDCPSHRDAAQRTVEGAIEVIAGGDGVVPSGPFVLRAIARREGFDVALLAHREQGRSGGWFVATVVPRLAAPPRIGRDVVFVIDRSGSMSGRKIEQARAALGAGLATLKDGDRFDVISFSSDVTPLGERGLLEATPQNLERARRAAAELSSSGGTQLHGALLAALERRPANATDRLFAIVLLTDGDPTVGECDPERILAAWRERCGAARLFAFGVGNEVKDFLLTKLAREGRGDARYVREGDDLEVPLAALFDRVRTPLLLDPVLEVESDGVQVLEREPTRLPDAFQGRALVVAGRFEGSGQASLRLRGRSGADEVAIEAPVVFPADPVERPHVKQIWAKTRCERLLDDLRALGPNAEMRAEVLALGLEHGLVTPYTSFLVVEEGARLVDATGGEAPARPIEDGTPWERSPEFNDAIGLGGGAGAGGGFGGGKYGRRGGARAGGRRTVTEIERALGWLAKQQDPDGSWAQPADPHATALSLLALLGAGNTMTTGRHADEVRAGLRYLQSIQHPDAGRVGDADGARSLATHAVATLVLVEAYHLSREPVLRGPAQTALAFLAASRAAEGGWGGEVPGVGTDPATGFALLALFAGKEAGFTVDLDAIRGAIAFLERRAEESDPRACAMFVLARILDGGDPDADAVLRRAADAVLSRLPGSEPGGTIDAVGLCFGSYAMFQVGGRSWDEWSRNLSDVVVLRQRSSGDEAGTWDPPIARSGHPGSRAEETALHVLCLQAYYRYDKLVGTR